MTVPYTYLAVCEKRVLLKTTVSKYSKEQPRNCTNTGTKYVSRSNSKQITIMIHVSSTKEQTNRVINTTAEIAICDEL